MKKMEKGYSVLHSKPFAHILSNGFRGSHCDSCLLSNEKLLKCSKCAFVYYCDRRCQKLAWSLHKRECSHLKRVYPNVPTDSVRLLAQIIFKMQAGGNEEFEICNGKKRKFEDLLSHEEQIKLDGIRMNQFTRILMTLKKFIGEENMPEPKLLLTYFGKMVINSLTITSGDLRAIGVGLYLGLSIFNHSCKANAVINFDGIKADVRTITNVSIKNLDQVFISYIDQISSRNERVKNLSLQYYFTCKCEACTDEERNKKTCRIHDLGRWENFKDLLRQRKENIGNDEPKKRMEQGIKTLNELKNVISIYHYEHVKEVQEVFDCSIESGSWENALQYGHMLIDPYKFYYGQFHSAIGITFMKLGKIALYLEKFEDAERSFSQAESVICVAYGKDHSIYKELCDLMLQCQSESGRVK